MILFLFTIINVLILYFGVYIIVKKNSTIDFDPLLKLISIIILFIIISFLYYLTLAMSQNFLRLLLFLTFANTLILFILKRSFASVLKIQTVASVKKAHDFWALFAVLVFTCWFFLFATKYGGWDAITMWNLKAKFLFYPTLWKSQFANDSPYLSRDYPLMVPSIIAFFWSSVNSFTVYVPMLFALLTMIVIPLLVYYSLINAGLNLFAYLSLAIFIIDVDFKSRATAQEADELLSMFILAVFILYKNLKKAGDNQIYLLSFICASCAWIKNEGMVFCFLFTIVFFVVNFRNSSALKKYVAGMMFPILILISFKYFIAPGSVIIRANSKLGPILFAKLTNFDHYAMIGKFGINVILNNYMLIIVLILLTVVFNFRIFKTLPFVVITLQLLSYFIVYLIAPGDLEWLLGTSFARILQHVFPALIYLLFLSLKKATGKYQLIN